MVMKIKDLDGMSVEAVSQHIGAAVCEDQAKKEHRRQAVTTVEVELYKIGTPVVYLKDGEVNFAKFLGMTKTFLNVELSHYKVPEDLHYLEYSNGCSGSHPASQVFLTMEDAKNSMFPES